MMSLKIGEPQEVSLLCLEFEKGDEHSKQVYIRDQLDDIYKPYFIEWLLRPMEVGIHPLNRDEDGMTPLGVWLRGGRILASGYSYKAIGKLWAFEDQQVKTIIQRHTMACAQNDPRFGSFATGDVKVGPANWTLEPVRLHGLGQHTVHSP
jgi:hypothetical protein